jgi:hypothetical protein
MPTLEQIDQQIEKQLAELNQAKADAAVGAENAPDTVQIGPATLFKPTLAHVWFYNRLNRSGDCGASLADFAVCLIAVLTLPQDLVRNVAIPLIGSGSLSDWAYGRLIDAGLDEDAVNEAYVQLWKPVLPAAKKPADKESGTGPDQKKTASSPAGGAA